MPISDDSDVEHIAEYIVSYLNNHPNAADTVEGITEWWLLRQQIEISSALVQEALDYLVSESVVKINVNLSANKVYSKMISE